MDSGKIRDLIAKYGLPLDIKKEKWYGNYYFHAQKHDDGYVTGIIFCNGAVYKIEKSFSDSVKMELCHPYTPLEQKVTEVENPNGLNTDKSFYIKGVTKLFLNKNGTLKTAYFDRFETTPNGDVIYVIPEGETKAGFYPFPVSTYVFPNKDDATKTIDKTNRNYSNGVSTNVTVNAFNALPKAKTPTTSVDTENTHEKKYHESVDNKLVNDLIEPKENLSEGQTALADSNATLREELIAARENGYMVPDHAYISHDLSAGRANLKIEKAQNEISRIERIRRVPYFARVDCGKDVRNLHTAYIGEYDIPGYVVDWRHSEIGNTYYHPELFTNRDDVFLALKRIITINQALYERYDDEINLYNGEEYKNGEISYQGNTDDLLTRLLAESRLDKTTHDIIKTIQGEQYDIITSDFLQNAVINGCAGSGKTMIMYHRLSYMAYNYERILKKKFDPEKVYIISPSAFFDSSNNELIKKLSIDKINQAPFNEQVDTLIGKYCSAYGITQFQGIISLLDTLTNTDIDFFSQDTYDEFWNDIHDFDDAKIEKDYKKWIVDVANYILEMNGFDKIPLKNIPKNHDEFSKLFATSRYFLNNCFIKRGSTGAAKYYSPIAITAISYENVIDSLNASNKTSQSYAQRKRRVVRNTGMLKACLSPFAKKGSHNEISTDISSFWNLVDNASAFEKMLALITVQNLFECLFEASADADYILKCLYLYHKSFAANYANDFGTYILRALSDEFGEIVADDSLVFVDEFQNYSSFELETLKSAFDTPIFNLFGDYDQRIDEKGLKLKDSISSLLSPNAYNININYRNAKQITEYINKAVHKNMQSIGVSGTVSESKLFDCTFTIKDRTAIICKDTKLAIVFLKRFIDNSLINNASQTGEIINDRFTLMTVADCKGLEFDTVYVLDYDMTDNEKYVAYTRALDNLIIIPDDLQEIKRLEEEEKQRKAEEAKQLAKSKRDAAKKKAEANKLVHVLDELTKSKKPIDPPAPIEPIVDVVKTEPKAEVNPMAEEKPSLKEQQLEEKLRKLDEYRAELERREAATIKLDQERKEKLYLLAKQKIQSKEVSQIKEAILLLETILDFKDSIELMAHGKIKIENIINEIESKKASFRSQKLCQHCGGKFKGLFEKHCRECGRKKDY